MLQRLLHSSSAVTLGGPSLKRLRAIGLANLAVMPFAWLISQPALADVGSHSEPDGEGYGEHALHGGLEAVNIALALLATILYVRVARRLTSPREAIGVGYVACCVALLGATRVFYILADRGVIYIHDDTLEFWWHVVFFQAMAVCVFGVIVLSATEDETDWLSSARSLKVLSAISVIVTIVAFLTAEPLDRWFVVTFDETFMDTFGVQHFVAFVTAALVSLRVVSSVGSDVFAQLKSPLIVMCSLFAVDHFWELLTESWEIFIFSESVIEQIEQIIVLPALLAALYGAWKLWSSIQSEPRPASAAKIGS